MDYQTLRHTTREALDKAVYPPKKLALIHVGATILLSVLMTAINWILARGYGAATGLGKTNQRAILETVQVVLNYATILLTPIWTMGFMAVALRTARWSNAEPKDLLDGFRCWGTVLKLYILFFGIFLLVVFAATQIASILFAITPLSAGLTEAMAGAAEEGQDIMVLLEQEALLKQMIPLYIVLFAVMALIGIPLLYRFRMSLFAVADGETGARRALAHSTRITRGKRMALFRLDLHFWWYYGALLLITALSSMGSILELAGISLPVSRDVVTYGAYGIYLVAELLLGWQVSLSVRTTYALCYDRLNSELQQEPEDKADPGANPWARREQEDPQ